MLSYIQSDNIIIALFHRMCNMPKRIVIGCFYRLTTNNDSIASPGQRQRNIVTLSSGNVFNSNTFLSERVWIKATIIHCAGLSLERSCQLSAITWTCGVYHILLLKQLSNSQFLLLPQNRQYYCLVNIPT